jgi:hypothetical protein
MLNPGLRVAGSGRHRASGGGGSVAFVRAVTAVPTSAFGTTITSAAIDTTGANFLVAVVSSYDDTFSEVAFSDSKGNTWHSAGVPSFGGGLHATWIFYAYNATVGTGHTFTESVTGGGGDGTPGMVVMAFSGMRITDPLEAGSLFGQQGNSSNSTCAPGGSGPSPAAVGDLIIVGTSLQSQNTAGALTINDSVIIAGQSFPMPTQGTAGGYLIATSTALINPTWGNVGSSASGTFTICVFAP